MMVGFGAEVIETREDGEKKERRVSQPHPIHFKTLRGRDFGGVFLRGLRTALDGDRLGCFILYNGGGGDGQLGSALLAEVVSNWIFESAFIAGLDVSHVLPPKIVKF